MKYLTEILYSVVSHEYDVLRGRYNACYLWEEPTDASSRLLGMRYYPFTDEDYSTSNPDWNSGELEDQGHNKAYHFHWDTNKNITHVTDEDGKIVAHYEYSAFGRIVSSEGDFADSQPFRFSCEYYDKELGLLAYNYRFYNPLDGRFLSRDPIGESGGYNLYGFCNNDPINNTDHLGLWMAWGHDLITKKSAEAVFGTRLHNDYLNAGVSSNIATDNGYPLGDWFIKGFTANEAKKHYMVGYDQLGGTIYAMRMNAKVSAEARIAALMEETNRIFKKAINLKNNGMIEEGHKECIRGWKSYGEGLHTLQDKYAHTNSVFYPLFSFEHGGSLALLDGSEVNQLLQAVLSKDELRIESALMQIILGWIPIDVVNTQRMEQAGTETGLYFGKDVLNGYFSKCNCIEKGDGT